MKTKIVDYYPDGDPKYEPGLIVCECGDTNHALIYTKWLDTKPSKTKEVYLEYCVRPSINFWERLKLAWRFLIKGKDYVYDGAVIINKNNVSGLEDIVNFIKGE